MDRPPLPSVPCASGSSRGGAAGPLPRPGQACRLALLAIVGLSPWAMGGDARTADRYRDEIQPLLAEYCMGCHGNGIKKGGVSFDGGPGDEPLLADSELWGKVVRNVRSGLMPPAGEPRPAAEQVGVLADWVKYGVLGIDPADPDPGRATIRRLNRVEYANTVRDLMGIEFRADEEFPPDDTGYGFDNIGDVLTVSPLLLEKYLEAAEAVVASAVPTVSRVVRKVSFAGSDFRGPGGNGEKLSFYKAAKVSRTFRAGRPGTYRLAVRLDVRGAFEFDPGRCRLTFKAGDRELLAREFAWGGGRGNSAEFELAWTKGEYPLAFEVEPLTDPEKKTSSVDLRIASVVVEGPLEPEHWDRPKNFDRFFSADDPGPGPERRKYAREALRRFASRAFRRPVDEGTLDRLAALAEEVDRRPGATVEQGVAQAMVAVLASPRFLFRIEESEPGASDRPFGPVDEYTLASRLSYFLWSTMPDDELLGLAARGALRSNLGAQVRRMLADGRSERLVRNFTGQWLQARDVEGISINARSVLARDSGEEKELKREIEEFRAFLARREAEARERRAGKPVTPGEPPKRPRFRRPRVELDGPLREAMRRETEMFFGAIVREDRSVLDLLDSDYSYLNERLAKHYGIDGVKGEQMRRVALPAGSHRGGLLTQGTVLVVTSNPTRTSPVKRGLFLLDNVLGTPPPPPPADIAQLEDSEKGFGDREPTLREVLERHRSQSLCRSCHSRMDPLGLALENFNAMGMWRESERAQPLDTSGRLITGEAFDGIDDLKRILRDVRRADFYRCLTEKLLTYALGRGVEAIDLESVDGIVGRLDREDGRFSALLMGIIDSAPFQKRRNGSAASGRPGPVSRRAPES